MSKGINLEITKTYKSVYHFDDDESEDVWIIEGKRLDNGGRFWIDYAWWNDKWTPYNWYIDGDHADYDLLMDWAYDKIQEPEK